MDMQALFIAIVILIGVVMIITCGLSIFVGFVLAKVRHPPKARPLTAEEQREIEVKTKEARKAEEKFRKNWKNLQEYDGFTDDDRAADDNN